VTDRRTPPHPAAPAAPVTPAVPPGPPVLPELSSREASTLLDRLIYEQIVACVDLDALRALETTIALLAAELDGVGPDRAPALATALLDGALRRLPEDVRHYLDGVDGLFDDCPLCEDEARASRSAPGSGPRRAARPGS